MSVSIYVCACTSVNVCTHLTSHFISPVEPYITIWQTWPPQSGVKHESFRKSCSKQIRTVSDWHPQVPLISVVTCVRLTLSLLSENESVLSFFQQLIWNSTLQLWQQISWMKPCKQHPLVTDRQTHQTADSAPHTHLKVWIAEVDLHRMRQTVLIPADRVRFRRKLTHLYEVLQMFLQDRNSSNQHQKHTQCYKRSFVAFSPRLFALTVLHSII